MRSRSTWNVLDEEFDDILAEGFSPKVVERYGFMDTQYQLDVSWAS